MSKEALSENFAPGPFSGRRSPALQINIAQSCLQQYFVKKN